MVEKWRVLLLDTKKSNPNHYIALAIREALQDHDDVELVVKADYGNALVRAEKSGCNLFFAFDGEELDRGLCQRLKHVCGRSVVWFVEDPYEIKLNRLNAELFDLVFTNDKGCVSEYGRKGFHLPLAASRNMHYFPPQKSEWTYDLFFAGTAWPNRVKLLKSVEREIEGVRFKLALPVNEHLPAVDLSLSPSAYTWRTPNSEFSRFSNRSAVVLSLHRQFSTSGARVEALTPGPRLFEVAMAGGFQLIDREIPGINDYFVEGEDYAAFDTPKECISKLKYYLQQPEERKLIALSAQRKVLERHTYSHRIALILEEVRRLGSPLSVEVKNSSGRPKILIVSHNLVNKTPYGGVEIYIEQLRKKLANQYKLNFYIPDRGAPPGKCYLLLDDSYHLIEAVSFSNPLPTAPEHMLSCEQREVEFSSLLQRHGFSLVHFQHLIGHVPSLPYIVKAMGIPSVFSMHEYFAISHRFNLIDQFGRYREELFTNTLNMDMCLSEAENIAHGSHAKRRAFWSDMLTRFDLIHTNSATTYELLLKAYPHLDQDIVVQQGIPFDGSNSLEGLAGDVDNEGSLEVLVLGNFTRLKGADTLLRVFNQMREKNARFHVFGQIDPEFSQIIDQLNFDNVVFYGTYNNAELPKILGGKHISLHLSIWPETYCISLSEVWCAGIVPIVTNIGALKERVTHGVNGFIVQLDDVGGTVETILRLDMERDLLKKVRANINASLYVKDEEHASWISAHYERLLKTYSSFPVSIEPVSLTLKMCGVRLNSIYWAELNHQPQFVVPVSSLRARIPRHPYYLVKFVLRYIKRFGVRTTFYKVKMVVSRRFLGGGM